MIVAELQMSGQPVDEGLWARAALQLPGRDRAAVIQRWRNMLSPELKKGPWTREVRRCADNQTVL